MGVFVDEPLFFFREVLQLWMRWLFLFFAAVQGGVFATYYQ